MAEEILDEFNGTDVLIPDDSVVNTILDQNYEEIVPKWTWWWAAAISVAAVALIANLLFIIVVVSNRKRRDLRTFVTAITLVIAVLDILDVLRIMPIFYRDLFYEHIFRHVFCSLGIFHELAVAIFLISISVAVCVQAGRETKYYTSNPRAAWRHKILIPSVLLICAGAAAPFFLIPYEKLSYTCIDPFRAQYIVDTGSDTFPFDIYSTIVSILTYALPLLIIPFTIPIASFRTCFAKQCCVSRFKQPIGELFMVAIICLVYIGTIVGIILPRIDKLLKWETIELGPAPLLWELANNCIRPICYFLMSPGVWEGLGALCCRSKGRRDSEDMEIEVPLRPVTSV
ncbi:uncharacterized protein [Lepeophtheirus salmonis]|uniref:uncharacterized protein n=1 Tax=Lepeophtheirus salmonis TaxID=72036 RepID=UPI001AE9E6A3|nr:uncharacterized protein LOC121121692 [Lepeophtheirus salmonis]